jgi:type I restriction enzyme S subunit
MKVQTRSVSEIADQIRGVTYGKQDATKENRAGYLPVLRAGNITEDGLTYDDLVYVPSGKISDKQRIRKNDIVIAASSGSLDVVGKAARALNEFDGGFGAFCKVLRPRKEVNATYFFHYFKTPEYRKIISSLAAGANINNLRNGDLDDLQIPLPPLDEQKRIAAILDAAEALHAKRRQSIAQLDALIQSTFLDLFGDPAENSKRWPLQTIGSLASKFSDGPFGSNLKSAHYTDSGVRVVRLQNIGIGEFVDDDSAFISEDHFSSLAKHECVSGDILIGTLGDPNLRACIQPSWLPKALNKADCVQFRANPELVTSEYVCALLNNPSTENLAQSLMLGQTRIRISMGRLRGLRVPLPPLPLQQKFAVIVESIERQKAAQRAHLAELDTLFAALQHRAFRGEL